MRSNPGFSVLALTVLCLGVACSRQLPSRNSNTVATTSPVSKPEVRDIPSALPNRGFKAELTLIDPPTKLRSGQKENVRIKIKNASDVMWWARGAQINNRPDNKFYIAAGDRWLNSDGSLLTNMDGRLSIGKDLKAGDETEVSLLITAPKEPGNYVLEIDLVQEGVAWFSDKGSTTAKTKVSVVR